MIAFLHPWLLAALPAVALPVILHLLTRREPPTVPFPAVRYLRTATVEHERRFRLQHWLLLALRMLLILALVLAAAAPSMPLTGVATHAPAALVIVLDNSASSGAVSGGTPRLAGLVHQARTALDRATPEDALWLVLADGHARRGSAPLLRAILDSVQVLPTRMDLGAAVTLAGQVLRSDSRPGEILVLSDLQATAVTTTTASVPLIVSRPGAAPPPNRGIAALDAGPAPWTRDGGRLTITVSGDSGAPAPVTARLAGRPPREVLIAAGDSGTVTLAAPPNGWYVAEADLAPDEFRLDDHRETVVRVAPVAAVSCDANDRFISAACEVLAGNHRIVPGRDIALGSLGRGRSVVLPPADPAELGAVDRALAARGSSWRFGDLRLDATATDSGSMIGRHRITRRYTLVSSGSGRTGVLATAGGAPWIVRSGDLVLVGSRLDADWTDLPLSAEFMPFMDRLLNRAVRGEVAIITASAGAPAALPDRVDLVRRGERTWRVEGGDFFTPPDVGAYFLLVGTDTIGALVANVDPAESRLAPATDDEVRRLWPGSRIVAQPRAGLAAFSSGSRADLRGPLLWLALAAGLVEVVLAGKGGRRTS